MARINLPVPETMTPEQRAVFDAVVRGPRGTLIGPLRAALHSPELAERWQQFGEILRYRTSLPARLTELAILVTARRWNSELEWVIHAKAATEAGLPANVIEAIRSGEAPEFADPEDAAVYEYARELQQTGEVSEATYDAIRERWHDVGVVELTAVIGYYTMVSMTLNSHHIPLPDHIEPALGMEPDRRPGLSALPAARARPNGAAPAEPAKS